MVLDVPYNEAQKLGDPGTFVCQRDSFQEECDSIRYGSLLRELARIKLWPQIRADSCSLSVTSLISKISEMRAKHLGGKGNHWPCSHMNFPTKFNSITSAMPDPVCEQHRRHMEAARSAALKRKIDEV